MKIINATKLIKDLDRRIEFHRSNQSDPYNLGNAAILVLTEVRNAVDQSKVVNDNTRLK